ncbi:hypothetical protein CkaCkLH20_00646 [Colletotrichum karsti]|uniref:Xylanolytic transcriptional activator regulatory domain-containing protein n=1 Tax=Colletotrichum karsti TaxID=1095194 RepID=A0A9P6IJE5_9PEZI|nr:uncharacterized protein CkaCkLH20_00646 [Colletotrichum karsti]KAF9881500.1 hypothetical protein CkaCkLH20_00646 [Colletotrichum karsti]
MPELRAPISGLRTRAEGHVAQGDTHAVVCDLNQHEPSVGLAHEETVAGEASSSDSDDSDTNDENQDEDANPAGALVRDSYGRPRFIGGATHNILIEAAKSLLPAAPMTTPSSTGASHSAQSIDDLELPLFVRGKVWPDSPFIPKPETLPRPPQYIADVLISLYFDKLHYTFPVLFRPHFMRRYQKLLKAGQDCSSPKHRRFLMVFFAVCACSSSLLPSHSENELPGIEYYQKALLMSHASNGEASLERIQCLALLSIVTSICLGRPMAIQDDDCDCELPLDLRDEDLEPLDQKRRRRLATEELTTLKSSPVSGFLAFARLCRLAGKIQRLNSPLQLRKLASAGVDKLHKFLSRVDSHDQALRKWLESLPPDIQFSANSMERGPGGDPALVMCVIIFILHAGSLLNLYRCFLNYPKQSRLGEEADISGAISQCVNAAQSCINAAEIVRDLVPTSHYLAICVHYMTLSGIVL